MEYKHFNYSGVFTNNNGQQHIIEKMVDYDDKRNPRILAVTNNNGLTVLKRKKLI